MGTRSIELRCSCSARRVRNAFADDKRDLVASGRLAAIGREIIEFDHVSNRTVHEVGDAVSMLRGMHDGPLSLSLSLSLVSRDCERSSLPSSRAHACSSRSGTDLGRVRVLSISVGVDR